ncbi:MAG: flavodoxin family protein [Clostridia bacterium]|nr:flavodoxin family protein [Clostridia bacterium]
MKTLILNGSPRRNGDTASLLDTLIPQLAGEIMRVDCYFADISPCLDCRLCKTQDGCAISDGMEKIYRFLPDCDNILIASPLYFSELTGKLLDVGSRLQTCFCARHFRGEEPIPKPKRGAVILVGGGDGRMEKAYETARTLFCMMNCREVHPLVCSHNTDHIPAIEDRQALAGIDDIAAYFNRPNY